MGYYDMPGYGGGMFPPQSFGVPDYMGGINDAFAQNAALGQQQAAQPKKGFGEFLRAFAGIYGDTLTGNPVYSQHMKAQQDQMAQMQEYERQRQDAIADYERKKQIDAQYSEPDMPGIAKETAWLGSLPPEQRQQAMDYIKLLRPGNFVPPSPVNVPYGATVTGGDAPPGGAPAGMPRVTNEQEYNALPPGTTYTDPNGIVRKKGGQSGAGPAGGFS